MKTTEALRHMAATDPARDQPVQATDDLLDWVLFAGSLGDDFNDSNCGDRASERPTGSQHSGLRGSSNGTVRSRRMRRPRWIIAAAVACAGAVAAFVLLPGGVSNPVDARAAEALLAAGRAAAAGVDAPLTGKARIYSRQWSRSLTVDYPDADISKPSNPHWELPTIREDWIAHDGAVLYRQTPARDWRRQARDEEQGAISAAELQGGSVNAPTYDFARTLPTDPVALEARIRHDVHGAGENDDVEVFVTVRDMLLMPVSPPALRAALFQVAAHVPKMEYLGTIKDARGRTGVAVGLSHGDDAHSYSRDVLIFDPQNGLALESQGYTLRPQELGLPASAEPVLTGRTVWEESGVVAHDGLRPDGSQIKIRIQPEPKPGQH